MSPGVRVHCKCTAYVLLMPHMVSSVNSTLLNAPFHLTDACLCVQIAIVLEYMDGGTLADVVKKVRRMYMSNPGLLQVVSQNISRWACNGSTKMSGCCNKSACCCCSTP
jgi:hypothetical protein